MTATSKSSIRFFERSYMEEQERIVKGIWIPIEIWKDKNLSWNEKLLYLEIDSFTSNDKDCFISDEYIANFLGINTTNANKTLSSLIKKGYVIKTRFDGRHRFVKAALSTPTTLNCQEQQTSHAHDSKIITNNNKDNITNTITINEKEKKSKGFVKPTIQEIQAHILEKGYTFDAEAFYAFYESNGWKVGKNPMKNWKAACTTWAKNRNNNNNNNYGRETITDKIRRTFVNATAFKQRIDEQTGRPSEVCNGDTDEPW